MYNPRSHWDTGRNRRGGQWKRGNFGRSPITRTEKKKRGKNLLGAPGGALVGIPGLFLRGVGSTGDSKADTARKKKGKLGRGSFKMVDGQPQMWKKEKSVTEKECFGAAAAWSGGTERRVRWGLLPSKKPYWRRPLDSEGVFARTLLKLRGDTNSCSWSTKEGSVTSHQIGGNKNFRTPTLGSLAGELG